MEMGHLPKREFESVEAFKASLGNEEQLLIDVTERPHQRPQDKTQQQSLYSGKKTPYHPKLDD